MLPLLAEVETQQCSREWRNDDHSGLVKPKMG